MSSNANNSSSGIGFVSILTLLFTTLKLLHKIDWSWWWVLSPIWICGIVTIAIIGVVILVTLIKNIKE